MISLHSPDGKSIGVRWDDKTETEIRVEWNGADGWKIYKGEDLLSEFHVA